MDFTLSETSLLLSKFRTKFATSCSKNIIFKAKFLPKTWPKRAAGNLEEKRSLVRSLWWRETYVLLLQSLKLARDGVLRWILAAQTEPPSIEYLDLDFFVMWLKFMVVTFFQSHGSYMYSYNFHNALRNTEQLLENTKLWQGVVEERRLLQTYGFPFVEGPWFKKDLMVPQHMPIRTGIHSPSENGI